jgi:hypothetical protein
VVVPADAHTPYVPPHPHRGTKYHRYVLLLLPQPEGAIDVPTLDAEQRAHFDVRAFCAHYALDGAKGGGAHMWRAVWSEDVSKMYGTRLGQLFPWSLVRGDNADGRFSGRGATFRPPTQARPVCRGQALVQVRGHPAAASEDGGVRVTVDHIIHWCLLPCLMRCLIADSKPLLNDLTSALHQFPELL